MCKCQIRAYIVLCDNELFLYPTFEVRLPFWDIPLDDVLCEEFALFGSESNNRWELHFCYDNVDDISDSYVI